MNARALPSLRAACWLAVALLSVLPAARAQNVLYITNGDSSSLQAIDTVTGSILFSVTTSYWAYPIAVTSTSINLGYRENPGLSGQYNLLTGAALGTPSSPSGSPNWTQAVDGTSDGTHNYTFGSFNATSGSSVTVYQTDANWNNPVALFNAPGSTPVGLAFDTAAGTLWINDYSHIYQFSLTGTLLSQFAIGNGYGGLAYQATTDTLWFVPNSTYLPLQQYSTSGTLLQSLTVSGRSSNVFGAEFQAIPEPATWELIVLGAPLLMLAARRRRK